ncbi:hypothetical protein LX32DRAFT_182194 [Colletotrichum zoysiae]|uniref:Uncharacterized protein n=1 Tax=Colletotrichum zoysiae TaxID=1216348 RepID=A0AAD9M5J9_9PEZI|nr:hypothetical protein LX32DRAFT_182194 [Colletotrichum zoysiae]
MAANEGWSLSGMIACRQQSDRTPAPHDSPRPSATSSNTRGVVGQRNIQPGLLRLLTVLRTGKAMSHQVAAGRQRAIRSVFRENDTRLGRMRPGLASPCHLTSPLDAAEIKIVNQFGCGGCVGIPRRLLRRPPSHHPCGKDERQKGTRRGFEAVICPIADLHWRSWVSPIHARSIL